MNDYQRIPTSAEVCAVLRARHHADMGVHSSFSNPDGTFNGGPGERGVMETAYALKGCDWPLIEYRTTWAIDPDAPHKRINEQHECWLCLPIAEES